MVSEFQQKILSFLENNARLSVPDIAKMVSSTEEEVSFAIKELENSKIIAGYHTVIDFDKLSEEKVNALIEVKVNPQRGVGFDMIAKRIALFEEVDSIYLISGGFDFLVEIKGRSMKEVSQFVFDKLSTLDTVVSTATHFVLKKYKDHGVLMEKKDPSERGNILL